MGELHSYARTPLHLQQSRLSLYDQYPLFVYVGSFSYFTILQGQRHSAYFLQFSTAERSLTCTWVLRVCCTCSKRLDHDVRIRRELFFVIFFQVIPLHTFGTSGAGSTAGLFEYTNLAFVLSFCYHDCTVVGPLLLPMMCSALVTFMLFFFWICYKISLSESRVFKL